MNMGILLVTNDFGKSFPSMDYLNNFPQKLQKIDRGNIHEVDKYRTAQAILRGQ